MIRSSMTPDPNRNKLLVLAGGGGLGGPGDGGVGVTSNPEIQLEAGGWRLETVHWGTGGCPLEALGGGLQRSEIGTEYIPRCSILYQVCTYLLT